MNTSQVKKTNPKILWLLAGCLSVFLLLAWGASAAPPAPAAAPAAEPGFFENLRSKLPDNPFAMDEAEKLEIVREYNAGTAAAGQAARVNAAKAQRDAAAAAEARGKYETSLRALRNCVNAATNR